MYARLAYSKPLFYICLLLLFFITCYLIVPMTLLEQIVRTSSTDLTCFVFSQPSISIWHLFSLLLEMIYGVTIQSHTPPSLKITFHLLKWPQILWPEFQATPSTLGYDMAIITSYRFFWPSRSIKDRTHDLKQVIWI